MHAYNMIKKVTGWSAGFAGFGYTVAAAIAMADGIGTGIEIPIEVAVPAMTSIILLATASIMMRVGQHVGKRVVEVLVSDHFELLVSAMETKLQANNAVIREMVKTEVAQAVDEVSTRTYRAAVVKQATDLAAAAAEASVTRIPTRHGG